MADDDDSHLSAEDQRRIDDAIGAVDRLGIIVDAFTGYVFAVEGVKRHGIRYRLNLLWLHAAAALLLAPLVMATGRDGLIGPSLAFFRNLPGTPYSAAVILGIGGLILGWGCIFRFKRLEIFGLALLSTFYISIGISVSIPAVKWIFSGGQDIKVPLYGVIVYGHLAAIMVAHIIGLLNALHDDDAMAHLNDENKP